MEIEAKYRILQSDTFADVLRQPTLGPFTLTPEAQPEQQRNTYFDTPDKRLRNQRFGLRVREVGSRRVATLKGQAQAQGAVTERDEWEAEIDGAQHPSAWPDGELRQRTLDLIGNAPLTPTLTIETERHKIYAAHNGSNIAELSLDQGTIYAAGRSQPFTELEVELLPGANRADFEALLGLLCERYMLEPEAQSKLERGLALLDADQPPTPLAAPPTAIQLALTLFDTAATAHGLPAVARGYIQLAASAYAAALAAGAKRPERAARDALLATPLAGLAAEEQCLVAAVAAFQGEKLRPQRELAYLRLKKRDQALAQKLAALLALAVALAELPVDSLHASASHERLTLLLAVPQQQADLAKIASQSERWRTTIGPLELVVVEPSAAEHMPVATNGHVQPTLNLLELPTFAEVPDQLRGDEPLAEGARRMLRRMFEKMLAREEDVQQGDDHEDVHQMRVATRRLRASLQIIAPLFDIEAISGFRRGLRRVATALGHVRDYDVLLLHVQAFSQQHSDIALEPLITAIERERANARSALLDDLDSRRYARFKRDFARFLTTPGALAAPPGETGAPLRVRDGAGSILWRRYEDWRAFEIFVPDGPEAQLHQARIAGKRLRYTIEFFAEALGPRSDQLLEPLTILQETLGNLQDGVVARGYLTQLGMDADPGAGAYLAARESEHATHMAALPRAWEKVDSATFRRRLFELIIKL